MSEVVELKAAEEAKPKKAKKKATKKAAKKAAKKAKKVTAELNNDGGVTVVAENATPVFNIDTAGVSPEEETVITNGPTDSDDYWTPAYTSNAKLYKYTWWDRFKDNVAFYWHEFNSRLPRLVWRDQRVSVYQYPEVVNTPHGEYVVTAYRFYDVVKKRKAN